MVSENTIFFYPGRGGHSHDGENSSFIDTSKYSLFDFSWGLLGDPDRQASQDRNYNSFKDFIINTVNQSILNPAGLVLQPGIVNGTAHIVSRSLTTELIAANAITANEILANTITANELAANLVLVNNIIRSNNFDGNVAANGAITSAGTVGWAVSGHGQAVFDTTFIRGSLVASSVSTPGVDIDANGNLTANTFALYANGAIVTSSGNFSVNASGNLTANNADITGTIYATSGGIGNWDISGGNIISSDGQISLINDAGDTVIIAQSAIGTFAAMNSDGSITLQNGSFGSSQVMNGASYYVVDSIGRALTITGSGISSNLYGTVLSASGGASLLDGYAANNDEDDGGSIPIRGADASVRARYFVTTGGVTGSGSTIIRRSDGYILVQSSRRDLKTNIEDISDSLNKIAALRPRIFNWKPQDNDPDDLFHREIKPNHKTMGFVVEEVAEISPEYLEYSIKNDELDAHYWKPNDFIALAIQGIKDLSAKVDQLEARIAELEG